MTTLVFLGGMGRSGTNLLRNMLDCHPKIAAGPEFNHTEDIINLQRTLSRSLTRGRISSYLSEPLLNELTGNFLGRILEEYGRHRSREFVVEKTPSNIWYFLELATIFPTAKFIHMIRDGRDVCCSHREVGERLVKSGAAVDKEQAIALFSIFHCAALWNETVRFGLKMYGPDSPLFKDNRVITVRYEDLVLSPEHELRRVCSHLGIDFNVEMLHPEKHTHDTFVDNIWVQQRDQESPVSASSVGKWVESLTLKDRVLFAVKGYEGLVAAGYENSSQWPFRGINISPEQAQAEVEVARKEAEIYAEQNRQIPLESLLL